MAADDAYGSENGKERERDDVNVEADKSEGKGQKVCGRECCADRFNKEDGDDGVRANVEHLFPFEPVPAQIKDDVPERGKKEYHKEIFEEAAQVEKERNAGHH